MTCAPASDIGRHRRAVPAQVSRWFTPRIVEAFVLALRGQDVGERVDDQRLEVGEVVVADSFRILRVFASRLDRLFCDPE